MPARSDSTSAATYTGVDTCSDLCLANIQLCRRQGSVCTLACNAMAYKVCACTAATEGILPLHLHSEAYANGKQWAALHQRLREVICKQWAATSDEIE